MAASVEPLVVGRVIGDVVDMFVPSVNLSVYYGPKHISNGCEIKPSMAINPPRVLISGPFDELFTLVMTDPDAPSPSEPIMRELEKINSLIFSVDGFRIVVNIPGGTNPTRGKEILSYSSPRPHLGIHRYIFVLFRQKSVMNGVEQPKPCSNFSTRAFANYLELGVPVATVYFNAQKEPASKRR